MLRELSREFGFCSWRGERKVTKSFQRIEVLASRKWVFQTPLPFPKLPP